VEYTTAGDLTVSRIGVGCYALSGVYGRKDPDTFRAMLKRALELGVNFFDTADTYGDEAEELLGEVLQPVRKDVIISTKIGIKKGLKANLSYERVKEACEESLKRLKTDYIDIYQIHFDDPSTPVEETLRALEDLVKEGKIRHYGIGHLPKERVLTYLDKGNVFTIMTELSAVARDALTEILPLCSEKGPYIIAFSVTGRGILTGKITENTTFSKGDIRNFDPLFQREHFRSALRIQKQLEKMGKSMEKARFRWE